jgi:hypothetical protein
MAIMYLVLSALGVLTTVALKSYFTQKGKNKALLEDNRTLTEQNEAIKAQYVLDIEKRKYQYEQKSALYTKYFTLLDELGENSYQSYHDDLLPILDEFNRNYLGNVNNENKKRLATTVFSAKLQKLMLKGNEKLIRLRSETNLVKVIAGQAVLDKLADLEYFHDASFEKASESLKIMTTDIPIGRVDRVEHLKMEMQVVSNIIKKSKIELIGLVREELNQI